MKNTQMGNGVLKQNATSLYLEWENNRSLNVSVDKIFVSLAATQNTENCLVNKPWTKVLNKQ